MTLDVARARAETPGCEQVIHFNNAGAALMPTPVLAAVREHLELEARAGGYEAAEMAATAIEDAYGAVAALVGASPDEIALMESATRAFDIVVNSVDLKPGDRILVSTAEYASNYIALLQVCRRTGAVIEVVPSDEAGRMRPDALEATADRRTRLIVATHVPASSGTINPIVEIGAIARDVGAVYVVDACQSVGQLPIDVAAIGCDFLVGTGRKYIRAPRGTGFLYVRRGQDAIQEPAILDYHAADWTGPGTYEVRSDARRFESFEYGVGARIGLGVAARYAAAWGLDRISGYVSKLAAQARAQLADLPAVEVLDRGSDLCGLVTFRVAGVPAGDVRRRLLARRINTWVVSGSATRLDLEPRGIGELVRASVHYYNNADEVGDLAAALRRLIHDHP